MRQLFAIATIASMAAACNTANKQSAEQPKEDVLAAHVDSTVNPGDDFFTFSNGKWIKNNPIPSDETSWGIANLVNDELYTRKLTINENAAKKGRTGIESMIGNFWLSGMDTNAINQAGVTPLKAELEAIQAVQTSEQLIKQAASMHGYGVNVFYSEGVGQDEMNSEVMAYYLMQGGLGMPNRDYYFNTDIRTTTVRNTYPKYIAKVFELMGNDTATAQAKAKAILGFETKLAAASRKLQDLRDPYKNYNKMSLGNMVKDYPNSQWDVALKTIGVKHIDSVIVGQPEFLKALNGLVKTESIQTLKD
ncbi:MAG TPA: M13 family metallopeptidase N-terminal domain-containing protein, partial [Flavipsychrobacter sp.]|nr:M13 family metallopeptidase N-terminal domain-containing protein [Flavipsychrobacter sp.]